MKRKWITTKLKKYLKKHGKAYEETKEKSLENKKKLGKFYDKIEVEREM